MNTRIRFNLFSTLLLPLAALYHLCLVFGGFFFLSPEISLYPYLFTKGLVPYQQLIDQHFPLLFFGPINLAQIGVTSPTKTLILFSVVLLLIDLGFFLSIKKQKQIARITLLIVFVNLQIVLGGFHLWIETFTLLFLVWAFFFLSLKRKGLIFISGLLFGFVIGLRPTLAPFVILLLLPYSQNWKTLLPSLFFIPLLEIGWLFKNQLFDQFLSITQFNATYYLELATRYPTPKELVLSFVVIIITFTLSSSIRTLLLVILASFAAYPRFELYHLLPILVVFTIASSKTKKTVKFLLPIIFVTTILAFYIRRPLIPHNFFYPSSLYQTAKQLQQEYPSSHYYFFGGPDQLYQLTNTLPTGNLYLPSLPWYFKNPEFVKQQVKALVDDPDSLVIVNQASELNGQSLLDYGQPVWRYIDSNYIQIGKIESLLIYQHRQ